MTNHSAKDIILKGVLPALLLAICVGQIYAFTNFSSEISSYIGASQKAVQFAFSLGIFFLGMGAAFFGPIVEKNIKRSALIGICLFISGMAIAQVGVNVKSLALLYLGYGFLLGLGTGVIYITPVKTMLMWMPKYKAVASALPIIFFGLGSSFSTGIYAVISKIGITKVFWAYCVIYAVMMAVGGLLLQKPEEEQKAMEALPPSDFTYKNLLKQPFFISSWLFMFLNISAGLCLIPLAKQMMLDDKVGYAAATAMMFVALSGLFNGGGRFVFAWVSDMLKKRIFIIFLIIFISIISILVAMLYNKAIGISLLVINACYGAGFSVIPAILSDNFGMRDISKIHGAVLSAWGFAGLAGNQLARLVGGKAGFIGVLTLILCMHAINMVNYFILKSKQKIA